MKSFAEIDIENKGNYIKLLSSVSKLSGLFSDSSIPFINYRVAENIFCRSFGADNLSRSDTAFDANYNSVGIGLKTFICNGNSSTEKIAEFNSLSRTLKEFKGKELALKLGEFRNDRINLANRVYDIKDSLYHIVARKDKELLLYETDYNIIDISNIHSVKDSKASLQFEDGNNFYSFNYSKSTLFRNFIIPQNAFRLPIEIIEDPYTLLLELFENKELKPDFGIFFDGQIFDAYSFISDIIRKAAKTIILIDNYIDDSVFTLLSKRKDGVKIILYTKTISNQLKLDSTKFNSQFDNLEIKLLTDAHDRFLIIDEQELYHIGASLKDLGKKWFAFSKMHSECWKVLSRLK